MIKNMDKAEKKVFTIIIFIITVFVVCITVLSLFRIPVMNNDNSAKLSIGEAKKIVLDLSAVEEKDVVFTEQDVELYHGFRYYDFSFHNGEVKYEYLIDAHTGEVVTSSSEKID